MKRRHRVPMQVNWSIEVKRKFHEIMVCIGVLSSIHVERHNDKIQDLRTALYKEVREKYDVQTLKDNPTVRAYRDFYWKLDNDPTKTRPSGEALLNRVLNGNDLPEISTVVDAYNSASMKTMIPISGFDSDQLQLPLNIRFANNGEAFTGIGMSLPMSLTERMLIVADQKRPICVYPYRDSDSTKITLQTRNATIIAYGTPGIREEQLREAVATTLSYIRQVSEGKIEAMTIFKSNS